MSKLHQDTTGISSAARRRAAIDVWIFSALSAVGVALVAGGIAYSAFRWGGVVIGAGILAAAIVGVGVARRAAVPALYGVMTVLAVGLVVVAALVAEPMLAAMGVLALVVVGATAPLALREPSAVGEGAWPRPSGPSGAGRAEALLQQIHEHSMLSDNAKRILFREREIGLLRETIEGDLSAAKYDVALTLCDEMADVFGEREAAEAYRTRILEARQAQYEQEVGVAMEGLDRLLVHGNWAAAHQEVARIRRLFGDSHHVEGLEERVQSARQEQKRDLEGRFLQAAEREDVEGAMKLLRQLDRYLDPDEAERLSEVAHGIVSRHRENLGVQFKLAVNDRRWAEAVSIGEVIMREFPNAKMADEVRSMIDLLRTRATGAALGAP